MAEPIIHCLIQVPLLLVKIWLSQLFEFSFDHNANDRRDILASLFENDKEIWTRLPHLNSLLNFNMPLDPPDNQLSKEERERRFKDMMITVKVTYIGRLVNGGYHVS